MLEKNVISISYDEQGNPIRRIKSFVRHQGRLTKGQATAIDELWLKYGIPYQNSGYVDFTSLFERSGPLILEIGFGMGHSLIEMAKQNPDKNYLGIEVHQPGIGTCLMGIKNERLVNVRLICHDAVDVLTAMIANDSLAKIQLFFPDPWHKTRHHKRRLFQLPFATLVAQKLATGGVLHMATDWQNYAEHMLLIMDDVAQFRNLSSTGRYVARPDSRPITKFEQRGARLGHGVWDLMFEKL